MATLFKAGLIQTNVSNEVSENVAFVREQARLARSGGADRRGQLRLIGHRNRARAQRRLAAR